MSKITLALHGEGTLTIVENAEADRLTRMGYCTYQDRSTHAMGNLNAYTLSVCLHNYLNSPKFSDGSHSVVNSRLTTHMFGYSEQLIPKAAHGDLFSYSALIMVMRGTISPLVLVQFQQR